MRTFQKQTTQQTKGRNMIKNNYVKWGIILFTGAASYGLTYGSSQVPTFTQVFALLNTALVLTCSILTGFPKQEA